MLPSQGIPDPRNQLKDHLYHRLQAKQIDDQIFLAVQQAYEDVLKAENIILSRTERRQLLREILKEVLTEMLAKV